MILFWPDLHVFNASHSIDLVIFIIRIGLPLELVMPSLLPVFVKEFEDKGRCLIFWESHIETSTYSLTLGAVAPKAAIDI